MFCPHIVVPIFTRSSLETILHDLIRRRRLNKYILTYYLMAQQLSTNIMFFYINNIYLYLNNI